MEYRQGFLAAQMTLQSGKGHIANPYMRRTPQFWDWLDGWIAGWNVITGIIID